MKRKEDDRFYPMICRISNFHGHEIRGQPRADDAFSVSFQIYKPPAPKWGCVEVGADITQQQQEWLNGQMKRCAKKHVGHQAVVRLFTETIEQVSKKNSAVGEDVLIGMSPSRGSGLRCYWPHE